MMGGSALMGVRLEQIQDQEDFSMLDPKNLDELAAKLNNAIPESLRTAQHDLEKTLRAGLQGAMQRLDIVSREEFEVQSQLLARTREKLDAMEARVRALEAKLGIGGDAQEAETPTDEASAD